MKKIVCLFFLMSVMSLSACENIQKNDSMTLTDLTGREDFILSAESDYAFVYDIRAQNDYVLTAWVEKYVNGEKAEVSSIFQSPISAGEKTLFLATMESALAEKKEDTWTLAAGSVSLRFMETYQTETAAEIWGFNQHTPISINDEEILLAYIGYTDDVSAQALHSEFFSKAEIQRNEINRCPTVYLLKCKFIEGSSFHN